MSIPGVRTCPVNKRCESFCLPTIEKKDPCEVANMMVRTILASGIEPTDDVTDRVNFVSAYIACEKGFVGVAKDGNIVYMPPEEVDAFERNLIGEIKAKYELKKLPSEPPRCIIS